MAFLDLSAIRHPRFRKQLGTDFVFDYFDALGARTEVNDRTLLRVELNRDQLCELEQRPVNTWYAANHIPELTTLYLTFEDDDSEDDHVESGIAGSWRFGLMQRSAERIGAMTRLRIVPRHPVRDVLYRPFLIFGFEVSYRCSQRRSALLPIGVDLITGDSGDVLATDLLSRRLDEEWIPKGMARRRELRFKHAFEIACECVKEAVTNDPATWDWYYRSIGRYRSELAQVEEYFAQRAHAGETDLDNKRDHAIDEVKRRFQPAVEGRTVLGMLVLCPEHELPKCN